MTLLGCSISLLILIIPSALLELLFTDGCLANLPVFRLIETTYSGDQYIAASHLESKSEEAVISSVDNHHKY